METDETGRINRRNFIGVAAGVAGGSAMLPTSAFGSATQRGQVAFTRNVQTHDRYDAVVCGGGPAGFAAAFSLGAQGVQIGTRFAATHEAKGHTNFKNAILDVKNTGTVITGRGMGPTRCVKNKLADQILEMEKKGATPEELFNFIGMGRSQRAAEDGDVEEGTIYCGQIVGEKHDGVSSAMQL